MKNQDTSLFITATLGLIVLATAGCAKPVETPTTALPAVSGPAAAPVAGGQSVAMEPVANVTDWSQIKDYTYETRERFQTGLDQLLARVDGQITELTTKRAEMNKSQTDTQAWDFAMKEMVEARAYLKSTGEVLAKTARDIWEQQKDRVGQAWVRTQDAYGKVKSSTTS